MFFSVDKEARQLIKLPEKDFSDLNILERTDLESWVVREPKILGEDLLIITTEYDNYEQLKERLDVLAIDRDGKLVVVELKRDKADKTTDLQAIKYASYIATHTPIDIQEEYRKFWNKKQENDLIPEEVGNKFVNFLSESDLDVTINDSGWAEFELGNKPRIILAAGSFGKEVTSPVLWLRDEYGLDISCVEFNLFRYNEEIFLNSRILIPVPETEEYMAKRRKKEEEQEEGKDRRRAAIYVLLKQGIVKEAETVIFKKSRVPSDADREYDSDDDFWKARITGKTGQSNSVEWLYDGKEYSFTGLTKILLNKLVGRDKSKALNGYKYWCHPKFENKTLSEIRGEKTISE